MQLSARILTALAVLAFAVAIVAGAQRASEEVSAATGTIDALNVGACTSTNADVFNLDRDCSQKMAFYQQEPIDDIVEIKTLYATYAHDPKTAAEGPRGIVTDGDLIKVSITDKGRDRRDPVLITSNITGFDNTAGNPFSAAPDFTSDPPVLQTLRDIEDDAGTTDIDETLMPAAIVSETVFGDETKTEDLPDLEQVVQFGGQLDAGYQNSGSYEIVFERPAAPATPDATASHRPFKPIANPATDGGDVKFFGRVNDGGGLSKFGDIGDYISIDEDVISGDVDTQPAMALNVSVPRGGGTETPTVQLQLIYYETSGREYIQGADLCFADPNDTADNDATADVNEMQRAMLQAACTAKEVEDAGDDGRGDPFVLYAESDEDAADEKRHLALVETGRFTGIFQGFLQLTDADGDGGGDNWGRPKGNGEYVDGDANVDRTNPSMAVLGVGSGPVSIIYKDTDGKNRRYDIEIDIDPPTIQIDSPAHEGRSDDEKPSFIGSFNDSDSGLAADSFQLDVDNTDDGGDDVPVMSIDAGVMGSDGMYGQVRRRLDYMGYSPTDVSVFGVIGYDVYQTEHEVAAGVAKDYKTLQADDFSDGAPDGEFNEEIEIDFDEFDTATTFVGFNNAVDFQAVVRDLAGNFGFSDSDAANPRFINDLGAADASGDDKDANREKGKVTHNVLGVFSRHVVYIDELDPVIDMDKSVTGFYGIDDDKNPVRDRSAVMVVFDNSVNGDLIDNGTFTLEHGDEAGIEVIDVQVEGKLVFLKLGEKLASDATPTLSITEGREVEDLAGNVLGWQEKDAEAFEVNDGILPVFTLTLSGGSGTGVGSEGPSKLTNAAMNIDIASDEDITGSPKVSVVCSNIGWSDGDDDLGLSDYIGNRTGYEDNSGEDGLLCGDATKPDVFTDASSLSRPGNNWVYAWRNASSDARELHDGKIVVVVYGQDRSSYEAHDSTDPRHNWGSATAEFVLDSVFNSPLNKDGSGGSVQPEAGSEVKEPRPFVYLDFAGEATTAKVIALKIDGADVLADLSNVGANRYLYWPEALEFGEHKVEFDARDAADNKPTGNTSFTFNVTARDPFVLDITAGWNAVSFPANPVDTALDAVFTEEAIDRVVGWNPMSSTGPWSIASRIDGVWTTSANFAPLTDVEVRYGYWVHSMAFVKQSVDLEGPINRETGGKPDPIGIYTLPGWNFIGVVDQDGDQTEDNFGDVLQDSEDADVTAKDYMPGFRQAYTWDAIANGYRVLPEGGDMIIGKGIWVFFPDNTTIAP